MTDTPPRCHLGATPHEPHWWIDPAPPLPYYGDYPIIPRALGHMSRHCPGYAGDPPYGAEPASYVDLLEKMKSIRVPWAPEWLKTNSDRVAFDRLIELTKSPEQTPDYLLSDAPGSLTGIPIIYDDAIPSGMMVFVDQFGKMTVLDFRKQDEEKENGD